MAHSIIFVCTGNIFRSMVAEYAVREQIGSPHQYRVESAGIEAKPQTIHPVIRARLIGCGITAALCIGGIPVLAILAAIALPAYQDYIVRSKMSEPLAALAEAKTSISEFYASNNHMPEDAEQAGILTNPNKEIVASVGYTSVGGLPIVTAGIQPDIIPGAATNAANEYGFSLSGYTGAGSTLIWKCKSTATNSVVDSAGTTVTVVPAKYLPSNCRG